MCVSDCMVFKIRVGMLLPLKSHKLVSFFLTTAYQLFDMQYNVFGSKHWSNVQGNEENCWSRKQTRKQRRISRFCRSIFFFFGIKNVRVGGKVLGSIGSTPIYFFGLIINQQAWYEHWFLHYIDVTNVTWTNPW